MYSVLYAMSPEIFPAKDRGTGNALTATATRVFGVAVGLDFVHSASMIGDLETLRTGTGHCAVRESSDVGARVHCGWYDHVRRFLGSTVAVRT